MIRAHLLNRTARVHKAVGSGGAHSYADVVAFEWPCRVEPIGLSAQAQATGKFIFSAWRAFGNVPTGDGEIVAGDKLVLEDDAELYVTSMAVRDCPHGEYLVVTATRSA